MSDIPKEIVELATQREAARTARDFARADELRDQIARAGFELTDTRSGPRLAPRGSEGLEAQSVTYRSSGAVASVLADPPRFDATVQWIVQGWPEDVVRGIASFRQHGGERTAQHVVVDLTDGPPTPWPEEVEVIRADPGIGWAAGRNAGLRRASGRIVVIVDGSIEADGDVLEPLAEALQDPGVGVTGPFGIATEDLREFRESTGPEVDAVEGYLMAFRRQLVEEGLRYDERFRFYRTADIELSFQVKALGLRATVTPVPVRKNEHRIWANTPEQDRDRLSKRNFYRFLDRWRGRADLLVASTRRGGPGSPGSAPPSLPPPT